ncbi:Hypothetical protein MVR_LOCUS74 [uncultured virus]|nr:Hypothetical protein MVR_LOCUS74 [uncultured virus]
MLRLNAKLIALVFEYAITSNHNISLEYTASFTLYRNLTLTCKHLKSITIDNRYILQVIYLKTCKIISRFKWSRSIVLPTGATISIESLPSHLIHDDDLKHRKVSILKWLINCTNNDSQIALPNFSLIVLNPNKPMVFHLSNLIDRYIVDAMIAKRFANYTDFTTTRVHPNPPYRFITGYAVSSGTFVIGDFICWDRCQGDRVVKCAMPHGKFVIMCNRFVKISSEDGSCVLHRLAKTDDDEQ